MQSQQVDSVSQHRSVRLTINGARNLSDRPNGSKLDCFCVISISDSDRIFTTWIQSGSSNPVWNESFVLSVTELSCVLVQVFDSDVSRTPRLIGHAVLTPLHNPLHDVLNSNGTPVNDSAPLKSDGLFGNQLLDYELSTDTQQETEAPIPSTLIPREKARRYTQYITLYSTPILALFWLTYRTETVSQTFSFTALPPPAPPAGANHQGHAYALWSVVSSIFPPVSYGISAEMSPTRLPEPVRDHRPNQRTVTLRRGSRLNHGDIRQLWVPGPSNNLEVDIRIFGRSLRVLVPFVFLSRSPEGIAISVTPFSLTSFGMAKTEPLPL